MNSSDLERLARAIQQVDQARVNDTNRLNGVVNRMAQAQAEAQARQQIEGIKEILTHTYGKAQTYANIIMVAGYAAFFSMWASMREYLPKYIMLSAGLLMTLSIFLFVIAEIQKMAATAAYFKLLQIKVAAEPTTNLVEELKAHEKLHAEKQFKAWELFFYPSLLTGVLAGALLAGSFVFGLIEEFVP